MDKPDKIIEFESIFKITGKFLLGLGLIMGFSFIIVSRTFGPSPVAGKAIYILLSGILLAVIGIFLNLINTYYMINVENKEVLCHIKLLFLSFLKKTCRFQEVSRIEIQGKNVKTRVGNSGRRRNQYNKFYWITMVLNDGKEIRLSSLPNPEFPEEAKEISELIGCKFLASGRLINQSDNSLVMGGMLLFSGLMFFLIQFSFKLPFTTGFIVSLFMIIPGILLIQYGRKYKKDDVVTVNFSEESNSNFCEEKTCPYCCEISGNGELCINCGTKLR